MKQEYDFSGGPAASYRKSREALLPVALEDLRSTSDPLLVQSARCVVALAKGELTLGSHIAHRAEPELDELLEHGSAWSDPPGRLESR